MHSSLIRLRNRGTYMYCLNACFGGGGGGGVNSTAIQCLHD